MIENRYDIVIVGAGPVGTTTACLLKTLNKDLKICVLDKHTTAKRSHGLKINADSINQINQVLDQALKQSSSYQNQAVRELKNIFVNWKQQGFVRTNEIEKSLTEQANALGIKILRGEQYAITPEFIGHRPEAVHAKKEPLNPAAQVEFEQQRKEVREIFDHAKIIIGADGAHSVIRKEVMKDELIEEETFQYLVELKYQTNVEAQPLGKIEGNKGKLRSGALSFENIGKGKGMATKPVTFRAFIDKDSYEALRQNETDGEGNMILDENKRSRLKGVFGNSWSLKSLQEEIIKKRRTNQVEVAERMEKVYKMLKYYVTNAANENKACIDEQISALELRVFLSKHSVKKLGEQYVMLVGDANSGMILERGLNIGWIEAVQCAKAINTYYQRQRGEVPTTKNDSKVSNTTLRNEELPKEFKEYENVTHQLFKKEKSWARFKNFWIELARKILFVFSKIHRTFWLNRFTTEVYD